MMQAPTTHEIPTLTEVLLPGRLGPSSPGSSVGTMGSPAASDLLGPAPFDVAALEARLVDQLLAHLKGALEQRVHASVVPAVSLLADRIAYKAAQEVSANLAERMREDLTTAVRQAVDDALKGR
jgi:hypothetical protein